MEFLTAPYYLITIMVKLYMCVCLHVCIGEFKQWFSCHTNFYSYYIGMFPYICMLKVCMLSKFTFEQVSKYLDYTSCFEVVLGSACQSISYEVPWYLCYNFNAKGFCHSIRIRIRIRSTKVSFLTYDMYIAVFTLYMPAN